MADHTTATELMKIALAAIRDAGGTLSLGDVIKAVEAKVSLNAEEKDIYEKSGLPKWQVRMRWHSSGFVKAGLLKKDRGTWIITDEGEKALKLSADDLKRLVQERYDAWKKSRPAEAELADDGGDEGSAKPLTLEHAEDQSRREIEDYIRSNDAYDFQQLVAALLRGMGYTTPFVATKGPDGGTDIIAYRDPLGATTPHIRVQVKHKPDTKTPPEDVRALRGVLREKGETGLFVATGGFTNEAMREAQRGAVHIELIDLRRFHQLWVDHYESMAEADRSLMRLRKVFFLIPDD